MDTEFTSIKAEISRIGTDTTFNGSSVFTGSATSIFLSDAKSQSTIATTIGTLTATGLGLGNTGGASPTSLTNAASAAAALSSINTAIGTVASTRGDLGATINRLNSAVNVMNTQVQNLTSAENGIMGANIAQDVADMSKYQILNQTGISALAQANQTQQAVLQLLK
jgi:flagellin